MFKERCQELNFSLLECIFNITNKAKSDVTFSAYLFLSTIETQNEIEISFNEILNKYESYLKKCVEDFNNKDRKPIERTTREIMIDDKLKKKKFF